MKRAIAALWLFILIAPAALRATPLLELEREFRAGRMNLSTFLVARTFLALSPGRLAGTPFASLAESGRPVRWGAVFIRDVSTNYDLLDESARSALSFAVMRPTKIGGGIDGKRHILPQLYSTAHFMFHWTTGSDGGKAADAPPLADADASGVPDYIEQFASFFEQSWQIIVGARGFLPPPSDASVPNDSYNGNPDGRYDVFVYDMTVYGYTEADTSSRVTSSFIGVDNDYTGFPSPRTEAMQVTAAHEFCHACQFAYDAGEDAWWMEVTSTWMESEVFPEADDNFQYLPAWFSTSDTLGLTVFNGSHEYGSFLWAVRLSEDFGADVIRQIWQRCASSQALDAISTVLASRGTSFGEQFMRFVTGNYFLEQMYRRGADYRAYLVSRGVPGVNVEYRYEGAQGVPVVVDNSIVASGCWMDAFAADYVTVGTSPALPGYAVFFDGLDAGGTYGVRAVIQDADRFETFVCPLDAGRDGPMQVPSSGFAAAVVIIANLSTTDVANPAWKLTVGSVPDRPVNLVPANGGVTGRAPALTASGFSDADGGVHSASRWQVIDGLNTVLWDETTGPATGAVVSQGILTLGETYWWRVSYQDNLDAWSPWSEKTSFTTAAIPGDLDEDGLITSADVVLCLRAAIGLSGFSAVADMDSDGTVTIADVVLLLRLSLGL